MAKKRKKKPVELVTVKNKKNKKIKKESFPIAREKTRRPARKKPVSVKVTGVDTLSEKREILKKNLILAGIVVLLVVLNGWFYFASRWGVPKSSPARNNPPVTSNPVEPANNPSETAENTQNDKIVQDLLAQKEQENWQTYQNKAYGFEIKYPPGWAEPAVSGPQAGYKFRYRVTFRERSDTEGPTNGLDIYIYRNTLSNSKILKADYSDNIVVKDTAAPDYSNCNVMEVFSVGAEEYPAAQVYIQPNDPCFQETYFFSLKKGFYIFDVVPNLKSGINFAGFDGEKKVNAEFPEFYKVLATLNFPAVKKTVTNPAPNSVAKPAVKPKVVAPRVSGGIRCPEKIQHPSKSDTKGKHTDEDCCPDPDEYPKAGCAYSAHDYSIMLKRK
jgi:hypothetical protein